MTDFSILFYIPQVVKALPFFIREALKRYPFRAEHPRIGHYREYPLRAQCFIASILPGYVPEAAQQW